MTIRILVIDDELGRLPLKRDEFLRRWDLFPALTFSRPVEFTFITSQRHLPDRIENDAAIAVDFVANNSTTWALVLLDMQFDHGRLLHGEPVSADSQFGLTIQTALERSFPELPIVQFTAQSQKDLPRQDKHYLSKLDGSLDDLRLALVELGRLSLQERGGLLRIPDDTVVASEATIRLYANVYRRARANAPLLIRGETGTGKEHLARYFHAVSPHADGPFVALQVSSLPATLYESELFGHERGAFTGAERAHAGAFDRAAKGTVFLDEIGALTPDLQAKLLRVIGDRIYRRLGGVADISVECAIVAATQDDLETNGFREDLLARFSTVVVPPLRERTQEIPLLAEYFLASAQGTYGKKGIVLSEAAQTTLSGIRFPDNARGLKRSIDHAVMTLSSNAVIQSHHLNLVAGDAAGSMQRTATAAAQATAERVAGDLDLNAPRVEVSPQLEDTVAARPLASVATLATGGLGSGRARVEAQLSFVNALQILQRTTVPTSATDLRGALAELDKVVAQLRSRLAWAALARCQHPITGKIKVQPAMQLLCDSSELSPMNSRRLLNSIQGRPQSAAIDQSELQRGMQEWRSMPANLDEPEDAT